MLRRPQAARLLAVDRDARSTRLLLLGRTDAGIGSADGSALRLEDTSVADRHATIRYARGRYYVVDLKSAPGTFVNGRRIRRTQRLKHGDTVRFGGAAPYRFIDPDAQKRRRWRRNIRLAAVLAVLVAFALLAHHQDWGLVSVATLSKIVAMLESNPAAEHAAAPVAVAVNAHAQPTASAAMAAKLPESVEHARNVGSTASPHIASTPSATTSLSSAGPSSWIDRINFYRAGSGLASIHDNPEFSAAAAAHAHYLLLNFGDDIRSAKPMGAGAYEEKSDKSGYTAAGAGAAANLQLAWGCTTYEARDQIDRWIEGPFHRLAMLDPYLAEAGFGEASGDGCWVAALRLPPPPEEVKPYLRAVEFPPDGAAVALDWIGLEAPDPLASCPGYERPVGLPITLQIGMRAETKLTAHSLMADGKPIEHCVFDAPSYLNEDPKYQEYGRWNLRNAGAIVVVPRAPLRPSVHYSVSINAHDMTYAWSFTVAENLATAFTPIAPFPTAAPIATPTAVKVPGVSARPNKARSVPAGSPITAKNSTVNPAPLSRTARAGEAAGVAAVSSNWLTVLNRYRTRLNVPPVGEDSALSRGCLAHAKYLMTNYGPMMARGQSPGNLLHQEEQSKLEYSREGLKAAQSSDVIFQRPNKTMTEPQLMAQAIEWWISGPFHRPQLLNPELMKAGFGQYCTGSGCVSALDSISDSALALPGGSPLDRPIEVPPDGATVKAPGFGREWPSPVSSCTGYPTSASAVTLQLGLHVPAKISDASLTQTTGAEAGTKVVTCAYDSGGYTNPDRVAQAKGRAILESYGEVVMMVRDPLTAGETYRVAMTVNGKPYTWSFTVAP